VKVTVSPAALDDLQRLHTFLVGVSPAAAERAIATLVRAIESLDMFPDRGRPSVMAGARELIVPFGRSAYIVRYVHRRQDAEVIVLRVWHGRESRD
jgi:toxin ParE1/3/4